MECGQKGPPAAKFCPGCGSSMSLKNNAREEEQDVPHDTPDEESPDVTLTDGCVTISGQGEEELTIQQVLSAVPEGYQAKNLNRSPDKSLHNLSKEQAAAKLSQINTSDGSQEI